jgi:DNA polymerase III subunit gamma/tau
MAAQALYRRWRSQTFDELIGQEHVTQTLRNALRDGRIAHAYLFTGPRGTGKTSMARLLAKAVNCIHPDLEQRPCNSCEICGAIMRGSLLDLIEIDAASNRGIDEIRDLRDKVNFSPSQARYKVYVIDEVHMLTPEAFNALLKTLEEPPPHVIFVLATTEPHKIPDTVLSRCQRFDFRRIPSYKIVERLAFILEQEDRRAEQGALEMIARSAEGCMRDAISLMDQLLSYGGDVITESQVQAVRGTISGQAIVALADFLVAGDAASGLALINQMASEGIDLRQLAIQLVAHLRSVLLCRVGGKEARAILTDLSEEQLAIVQSQAEHLDVLVVTGAVRLLNQAGMDMRDAAFPQLVLELAWLDSVHQGLLPGSHLPFTVPASSAPAAMPLASQLPDWPQPATVASPVAAAQGGAQAAKLPEATRQEPTGESAKLPLATGPVPETQVVEILRANWTTLLQAAEAARGASLRGALKTLRNVVAVGDDIYFAFEHDFAKTMVERPANRATVQDLIAKLLGRPVRIHCQVGTQVTGVAPVATAAAKDKSPVASKAAREPAPEDLDDDPVVQHAKHHLGAVPSKLSGKE